MATDHPIEKFLESARAMAQLGGKTARSWSGRTSSARKADDSPVTEADHASQRAILEQVAVTYPGHAVLVEEELTEPNRHADVAAADFCWVVDPIDGTRNFGRQSDMYAVSVALMHQGSPLVGAVYDAASGQLFSAARGHGAFSGHQKIAMSAGPIDRDTIIMISSFRRRPVPQSVRAWQDRYLFRNLGSVCLHLAWVATGRADAACAFECKLWDLAASGLIIEEAGGVLSDHNGNALWPLSPAEYQRQDLPILAGTKATHAMLLPSLHEARGAG